jgi:hypothetical protein
MISAGRRISRLGGLGKGAGEGDGEEYFCMFDRIGIRTGWDIETSQLLCGSRAILRGESPISYGVKILGIYRSIVEGGSFSSSREGRHFGECVS